MADEKEIEIKTDEVNELLTALPKWIFRWGATIVFIIMLSAVGLSYFIKYPDTLSAKTIITTRNPPVTLFANANGKIVELKIKNNQVVKKGDVLLVIENTANYYDIQKIVLLIDTLQQKQKTGPLRKISYNLFQTGDLTPAYISFLKSYNEYLLQLEINPQEKE